VTHTITSRRLTINDLHSFVHEIQEINLSEDAIDRIKTSRQFLDDNYGEKGSAPTYGVNTGFGSLCNTYVDHDKLQQLQHNLLVSHACGIGDRVPDEIVRLMLLLKIQSLSYGHSGVSLEVVERLVDFYNQGVTPVVYQLGSLGASGDLAPLAHLALPLIGEGEVMYEGERMTATAVNQKLGWQPLQLQSKEGLALINGTQFMLAYGVFHLVKSYKLWYWSHITAGMGIDGFNCNASPFDERIHLLRAHKGQLRSAATIREMLEDSTTFATEKVNVQDPYSFRCVPQVHGATWDTMEFVKKTILLEVNSVTDNPNIFHESGAILSGGNFHGQPLALTLDYLGIAMAELGSISERRTFQLLSGQRGLPVFLARNAGLNSGMMILQYTAASIVSQNKQLANPASTDSIVSSNGQEDHVSMGANSATKSAQITANVHRILAIELLVAAEALEHCPTGTSPFLQNIIDLLRLDVPSLEADRVMHDDIEKAIALIAAMGLDEEVVY
jgi:histidine ammonia-lyase